ncbi:MAG: Asp-tRNA(Asn)/Glu-tRNA(Gln) amidotransferase subunit GatA [Candidatus Nanopelagicales bacterium]
MSNLTELTAAELSAGIKNKTYSAKEVAQAHLDRIEKVDSKLNAFLHVDAEGALAQAAEVDRKLAAGEEIGPLAGVPVAVKDIFTQTGIPTTCGSKILENWRPPYDSTVVARMKQAGMILLGKVNMDEFAMGSSTETSAYGPTANPWDLTRIPGGSSGGSSAAVAGFLAPLAVGTDTGGSIRQPAAVTGTVGVKPTYGGISRYGIVALASSLDQAGPFARTVLDAALLHQAIAGHDPLDSTSINQPVPDLVAAAQLRDIAGMKLGIAKEFSGEGYQPGVLNRFNEAVDLLRALGAEIVELSCPSFNYALPAYYLIQPSECSSNLARFDGMRYGLRVDDGNSSVEQVMSATRAAGFGAEVKRRIIIGTYALSSGYYDAYYGSAQKVRRLIADDFAAAFSKVDALISPTSPVTAFKIGEKINDPMAMYLNDICTIPVNLAGVGGMSVPIGLADEDQLPAGLQIMTPVMKDDLMYRIGGALEAALLENWGAPLLSKAPTL